MKKKTLLALALVPVLSLPLAAGPWSSGGGRLGQLAESFGLTDAQKEALHAAAASEKGAILAVSQAEKTARLALDDAIRAVPADPSRVSAASAAVAAADADLSALRARLYAKVFAVFTPGQAMKANLVLAMLTERIADGLHRIVERAAEDPSSLPRYARLGLTAEQKEAIDAVYASYGPQIESLFVREKETRAALLAAIRQTRTDEAGARAASAAVAEVDAQLAQVRAKVFSEVNAILTAEQAAKAKKVHDALRAFLVARFDAAVALVDALL